MILYTLLEIVIPIIALSWFAILLFRILSYFKIDKLNLKAEILSQPLISIIIPARNENLNIKRCLESIKNQSYSNYEVIVIDDNSTDDTYKIAEQFCQQDDRFTIIKINHDNPGWVGKNYACHEGYKNSNGSILLFIDADTEHHPDSVVSSFSYMQQNNYCLLYTSPRQRD